MMMTSSAWALMADRLDSSGCQLVAVETNLVDTVWGQVGDWTVCTVLHHLGQDNTSPQPDRPENPVFPLDVR